MKTQNKFMNTINKKSNANANVNLLKGKIYENGKADYPNTKSKIKGKILNSKSTQLKKSSEYLKISKQMLKNILENEVCPKLNDISQTDSNIESKLKESFSSDTKKIETNKFVKYVFKPKIESKTSNFLNFHLGEMKYLDDESPKANVKISGINVNCNSDKIKTSIEVDNLVFIEENILDTSFNSFFCYSEGVITMPPLNVVSSMNIVHRKISSIKMNSPKNQSKMYLNVSIISSDDSLLSSFENSDYFSDTEEFDEDIKVNKVYQMKIKNNNLKSNLDILNLNYLLRCIFHKSEILIEGKNNCKYSHLLGGPFEGLPVEDKKHKKSNSDANMKHNTNKKDLLKLRKLTKKRKASIYQSISSQIRVLKKKYFL